MQKLMMLFFILVGFQVSAQTGPQAPVTTGGVLVPSQQSTDDVALAARVREQIRAKVWNFSYQNYNIFSQAGQVTIQGEASSLADAEAVLSAARTTPGIKSVVNGITVPPKF